MTSAGAGVQSGSGALWVQSLQTPWASPGLHRGGGPGRERGRWRLEGPEEMGTRLKMVRLDRVGVGVGVAVGRGRPFLFVFFFGIV